MLTALVSGTGVTMPRVVLFAPRAVVQFPVLRIAVFIAVPVITTLVSATKGYGNAWCLNSKAADIDINGLSEHWRHGSQCSKNQFFHLPHPLKEIAWHTTQATRALPQQDSVFPGGGYLCSEIRKRKRKTALASPEALKPPGKPNPGLYLTPLFSKRVREYTVCDDVVLVELGATTSVVVEIVGEIVGESTAVLSVVMGATGCRVAKVELVEDDVLVVGLLTVRVGLRIPNLSIDTDMAGNFWRATVLTVGTTGNGRKKATGSTPASFGGASGRAAKLVCKGFNCSSPPALRMTALPACSRL